MELIRILRLNSGEDVVSFIESEDESKYTLKQPMCVVLKADKTGKQFVLVDHFLPINIVEENKVEIHKADVLFCIKPNQMFYDFYVAAIENQENQAQLESADADEEYSSLLESLVPGSNLIH